MDRYYTSKDMAKLHSEACHGCGDCCRGMGDTIRLDPYDMHLLSEGLGKAPADLLEEGRIALSEEEGLILPHLVMSEKTGACCFLSEDSGCRIHPFRPGLCRLFPLGREYDAGTRSFRYFVVPEGCDMPGKIKVRIDRWLGVPDIRQYEAFISDWHFFLKDVKAALKGAGDPAYVRQLNLFILKVFYLTPYDPGEGFYKLFRIRLAEAAKVFS